MKLRKSSKIKDRRITLKRKVTSILIKRIIIVLVMAIVLGICTGTVLANPLISAGSTWRYLDNGTDQGTAWRQRVFNDAEWSSGRAQLGYGDGDEVTVVGYGGDPLNKYITTYFRHTFQVSDPDAYPALLLKVLRDDGCVVYLNGEEVARSNMPEGSVNYNTRAASTVSDSDESKFFGSLIETPPQLHYGNNVVAVEIHQRAPNSSDISFDLQLDVPLRKGPYLLYPGENTKMTVLWQLYNGAQCIIDWGQDTDYGAGITTPPNSDYQCEYTISDLTPGEKYFYRVVNGDSEYRGSFHAAPPDNARNVKFFAYGDTRSYPSDHDSVANEMINTYTADPTYQTIALHMGDWVNRDTEVDWQDQFFPHTQPNIQEFMANVPINGCKGNHEDYGEDRGGMGGEVFYKYWPYDYVETPRNPDWNNFYWSFDYGPVHVVVLDQYVNYLPGSAQYDWLKNDLAATTKPWKFIILHEPGWSAGPNPNNEDVQELIQNLRDDDQVVDIVFAGHNHNYVRACVNCIQHITTGGGGAPLYTPDPSYPNVVKAIKAYHFCEIEIQGETLSLTARDTQRNVIDAFSLIKTDAVAEIIGTWPSGIWYWNVAASKWTKMTSFSTSGDIAAGDFTGDGIADVASNWSSGLWYQNGATLGWTKVTSRPSDRLTAGEITVDGWDEIIGTWDSGIYYKDFAAGKWTQMWDDKPPGDIAAGDFNGDGIADVCSNWNSGLYCQNGVPHGDPPVFPWLPRVSSIASDRLTAGDVCGDGRAEIIGTWDSGIWYYDFAVGKWTKMTSYTTSGDIAAGDFTGDGKADVASSWSNGLWYQNGATLGWTKVPECPECEKGEAPNRLTAGDVTGN